MKTVLEISEKTFDLIFEKDRVKLLVSLKKQISGFILKKLETKQKKKLVLLEKVKKVFLETLHYIESVAEEIEELCFGVFKKSLREFNKEINSLENILKEA